MYKGKTKIIFILFFALGTSVLLQAVLSGVVQIHPESLNTKEVLSFITTNLIQFLIAYNFAKE